MIISVDEVKRCKEILKDVRRELDEQGMKYDKDMEVGIMIETPAAAIMSDELAKEVNFFSIGSTIPPYCASLKKRSKTVIKKASGSAFAANSVPI